MSDEKKKILEKVNELINKKTIELIKQLPVIHEVNDGIIIRFFTEWDSCVNDIKFKRIVNTNKPNEIAVFYYLPKGSVIELKERDYIHCMTCLNGKLELKFDGKTEVLGSYSKLCLDTDTFEGIALENTYVLTTNM